MKERYKLPEITAWSLISCMLLPIKGILAHSSDPCNLNAGEDPKPYQPVLFAV